MLLDRPVFLTGMMGVGKTSVGRALAARQGLPFVDLDAAIEERAGRPIRAIFAEQGEPAFRALEREFLDRELADRTPRIVALGGGALLNRAVRLATLGRGVVITLSADPAELARRLAGEGSRPVLGLGPDEPRLREILEARASVYAEAHATIDTKGREVEQLVDDVLRVVAQDPIAVALGERTYAVTIAPGHADRELAAALHRLAPSRTVWVTDDVVDPLVFPRLAGAFTAFPDPVKVVVPTGERHKTLASVESILRAAIDAPVDRGAVVVGVGGGVVTDIAGLVAALALRGLRWIAVPTTVLSMVDASVGGKTAVDLGAAKNAVGAFHQPSTVIVDPVFSQTETARAFRSGLAEVVKTALIGDPALYRELSAPFGAERLRDRDPAATLAAIRSSIAVKAGVVGRDEREQGERAHLNLGHTIGHALEAEGGFERLTHGEAVSLGLVAALRIGVALGVTDRALATEVVDVLTRVGLPTDIDAEPLDGALRWVSYDKKRQSGALRFVLVRAPGALEVRRIATEDLPKLLRPA